MTTLQLLWTDPDTQIPRQYTGELPITIGRGKENSIEMANEHGGPDNISVIVLHVERLSEPQQ